MAMGLYFEVRVALVPSLGRYSYRHLVYIMCFESRRDQVFVRARPCDCAR